MSVKRNEVRLNTAAHREGRDLFVQHLNAVTRREGMRPHEVISMWIDATFRAMRGATLQLNPEKHAENEAGYARIVKRCREPQETMGDLTRMLAACTIALEAEPVDFIGPVFEEFSASSHMGQFFTPHHLSKLMASLIVGDPEKLLADGRRRFITFQEPSCGVGGMVLATCEVLREKGINLATQVHWAMVDVDYSAHAAAYIQTNLCGISADVFHGNTLSLQTWCATPTLAAILHPKRARYNPDAVIVPDPPPRPIEAAATPAPRRKPVQLSLFLEDADEPAA